MTQRLSEFSTACRDYSEKWQTLDQVLYRLCQENVHMAMFGSVLPYGNWWQPAFFGFLPMCFVFVGCAMFQMSRELRELRQRLAELEQKGSG